MLLSLHDQDSFALQRMNEIVKDTDNGLWASFVNGDDDALHSIYTRFVDVLYAFGLRFSDDVDLVKDSIHDLFVDLYKYRSNLSAEVNVKSYLFTSLKRKICKELKKLTTQENHNIEVLFSIFASLEDQVANDDAQSELIAKLNKQLELLPGRQKEALYLRFNSDLEYEEIASVMNISVETCRTLVYRGIKQLREKMVVKHVYKIIA
nr:sigma-70 family RNA polymerase sigma factor [uncultured Pedobacter sp.]